MTQIALSNDLIEITAEINTWKQQAGQAVFEIGKRLKHVKETDLAHGQWTAWLESVDITPRTAQRMIQAYDQFGKTTHASLLPTSKIFDLLSLPESVDREEFVSKPQTVPSTGEEKNVNDMTRDEIREVTQALRKAEQEAKHWQSVAKSAQNQPPRIETRTIEVVPPNLKKQIEEKDFQITNLRHGYQEARAKLQEYETKNTVDFNEEQSRKQREKLQHEADFNTLEIRVHINNFLERVAITAFHEHAISAADPITKQKLSESIEMLDRFTNQIRTALKGRKLGGIVNE